MINLHKFEVTNHFSTPLLYMSNIALAEEMLPLCKSILNDENNNTNQWGYKTSYQPASGNGLESLPQFSKFNTYIKSISNDFLRYLGYDHEQIDLLPSIFTSEMHVGDRHGRHCHPGAILSGVFYLQMPENSSPIKFYDPRNWRDTRLIPRKKDTQYTRAEFQHHPVAGDLLIWESWLHHEVVPNNSDDRVTLVFNL